MTKFQGKLASLQQVSSPKSQDNFQICCADMHLVRFLANFTGFHVFLWISRDFADLLDIRGSATTQNIRSPVQHSTNLEKWTPNKAFYLYINSCAGCNRPWRTLPFLPLLTSSLLTKTGTIYTQLLQEEKIFPMMPRSEWSAKWSQRYAQKCSKSWAKNSKFPASRPGCSMLKIARLDDTFLEVF